MKIYRCTWFGDIQLTSDPANKTQTILSWSELTPKERDAVDRALECFHVKVHGKEANSVVLDKDLISVNEVVSGVLSAGGELFAVKYSSKAAVVSDDPKLIVDAAKKELDAAGKGKGLAVQAVEVIKPVRSCPMPEPVDFKEERAAFVVRKFLSNQQLHDFDKYRCFAVMGCDTGDIYRVTSRWSPECTRHGLLERIKGHAERVGSKPTSLRLTHHSGPICVHCADVPPSEEMLAIKFSIENFEKRFLNSTGHSRTW